MTKPQQIKKPAPMLSVADVAEMTGVSKMTVYRLVQDGVITGYRVGRSIRIDGRDVTQFMQSVRMDGDE